jgi:predicted RNase H-like HicB family nuclease
MYSPSLRFYLTFVYGRAFAIAVLKAKEYLLLARYRLSRAISKDGDWYVAWCLELDVTSQGKTAARGKANLEEAGWLYIESLGTGDLPEEAEEPILAPLETNM